MAKIEPNQQNFVKRHKASLQMVALVLILGLPFILYVFAQAGQTVVVTALIILMALVMLAIIIIS